MEVLSSRILLRPADLATSRRFYEQQLRLRVYREYGVEGQVTGVVFFLGGGHLELASGGTTMAAAATGPLLWLQVDDLDAEHERLRQVGVAIDEPPAAMPWGLHEMWVHDPDGVRIVIVEVPDDHPLRRRV